MSKKKETQKTDNKSLTQPSFIVGIGASAGGVEALTQFFEQVSADSGLAYVVILHLSPDYDSQLAQILQEVAPIPVTQVTKAVRVEADHVYVVPPDKQLQMNDGTIVVRSTGRMEERRAPVDIFLRTLAESHGPLAIAVILSGTGANGSMGLKRVKERGGAVFVQNPREAAFNEMPRHAIATDLVDDILPVAQIPDRIMAYVQNLGAVSIPEDAPQRPEDQQQALREVFTQLRLRSGHDFSNYKRSTLLRRLERRITIHNLPNLPAYAAFLREHPNEAQALLKDLLISVTNFFRDDLAFQFIEENVLPELIRRRAETLRIWVAGCATGEEAYSLAMLCAEQTIGVIDAPKVQIFATDIDDDAIATAREGLYTLNDAADVSPERLARFFVKEGEDYRIRREVREMILFANQNVLKDPPFSKLDLITCRNLLIYLNHIAQERVMETFHFSLNSGGYLMLGLSETVDGSSDLYTTVNREYHVYQSRQVNTRPYPVPESIPQLPQLRRRSPEQASELEGRPLPRISFGDLHQQLLEQYAPPSVILNEEYDILHFTPRAGRYLHFAGGELSKNMLKLIRPELRLELRTALYQAIQQKINLDVQNLRISLDDLTETLTLRIRPVLSVSNPAHGFILVLFESTSQEIAEATSVMNPVEPMAHQLEEELIRTKAQLRSVNEHHELQAEELKASNEELQAMNEELRSAAEELETSKEELQSINEELTTVNQELKVKVEESSIVGNNLQNLINSTDIATLFLDRSFRINLFTPVARQIFNLIPSDFGRPLSDITNRLAYEHLQTDVEAVLSTLQPIEREVGITDGRVFIMRVLPYRTAEDRINGVVLTFVEITDRKRAEEAMSRSEEKYRTLFDSMDEGVATMELIFDQNEQVVDFMYLEHNPALTRQTGITRNIIGRRMSEIFPDLETYWLQTYERVVKTGQPERHEYYFTTLDSWFDIYISQAKGEGSRAVVCVYNNITDRKRAEERQEFLLKLSDSLRSLSDPEAIQETATQITMEYFGADRCYYYEIEGDNAIVRRDASRPDFPSVSGSYSLDELLIFKVAIDSRQPFIVQDVRNADILDESLRQLYIQTQIISFVNIPLIKEGQTVGVLCTTQSTPRDWSNLDVELAREAAERIWTAVDRAHAEAALRETEQRLASIRPLTLLGQTEDLAQVGSWDYDRSTGQFRWSDGMYRLFGMELGQAIQPATYLDFVLKDDRSQAQRLVDYLVEGKGIFESDLRIQVSSQIKTLRIKAEVIGSNGQSRVLGVDLDITEQLQAQQQIRRTADDLQAVLNASPASIGLLRAIHDEQNPELITDFRLAVGNEKLAQFFNQPLNELLGQSADRFKGLLWSEFTLDNLRRLYYTKEYRYEEKLMPALNQDRWLALSVMRQDDGMVLTGIDITELKQIQGQQQQWLGEVEASRQSVDALAELRTSLNQRTELLRAVSHDLRGNFGIIQGALQLLDMAATESDRAQMMEMVLRNVRQATGLLTDLLDLARLETGRQERTVASFDASEVLQELGQSLQPVANEHNLELEMSGSPTLVVENDRQLVYRMAQNLMINALKYTHRGSVRVYWGEDGDRWWFEVVDTGPGLALELVAGLNTNQPASVRSGQARPGQIKAGSAPSSFDSTDVTQLPGEGIGLRIVRELAGLLEAQLHVSSEEGVGTRFRVNLPRKYATP